MPTQVKMTMYRPSKAPLDTPSRAPFSDKKHYFEYKFQELLFLFLLKMLSVSVPTADFSELVREKWERPWSRAQSP